MNALPVMSQAELTEQIASTVAATPQVERRGSMAYVTVKLGE